MFNTDILLDSLFQEQTFTNRFHTLGSDFYSQQMPTAIYKPELIHINQSAAELLDQSSSALNNAQFRDFICGNLTLQQSHPVAAIYAGHQFGHFVPQLGDGRALLLGEIKNSRNEHWEIQLKGAGITPYSRQGDGRAVLRSTIREYLCSEAMHGLGIATTRSLAMVDSQEEVFREQPENGAVMARMAPSFIRFGSFELFASRGQHEQVKKLADFVISHYYSHITETSSADDSNLYAQLLTEVVAKTARLIAQWQAVGFAHGVMNTDNMSILGLTLDYGPFGFLDSYHPGFICNHSDHQGRYSFHNQPGIAYWNLARLAEALLSLMTLDEANAALSTYESDFTRHYLQLMRNKLGFFDATIETEQRQAQNDLVLPLLKLMEKDQVDYTLFFRQLAHISSPGATQNRDMFINREAFEQWQQKYEQALQQAPMAAEQRLIQMNGVNPKYILRNYIAQIVIEKAEQQDYSEIERLMMVLQSPFDEHPEMEHYAGLPPDWATEISVSCSS